MGDFMEGNLIGKLPPRTANKDEIDMAEQALLEMPRLVAGFFLRDLGCNLPVTMDAIAKAEHNMGILRRSIVNKREIIDFGSCPKPNGPGFSNEDLSKAQKMEVVDYGTNTASPYTIYYLLVENKMIAQSRVDRQNIT
jgi:hypothetical protein